MRSAVAKRILSNTSEDTKIFVKLYTDIIVRINQILIEQGCNQKTLAEKLDKRPSEINKWLSGSHNLTLRSIAKIHAILGEDIVQIPIKSTNVYERETVLYRNPKNAPNKTYQTIWKTVKPNEEEKRYQVAS